MPRTVEAPRSLTKVQLETGAHTLRNFIVNTDMRRAQAVYDSVDAISHAVKLLNKANQFPSVDVIDSGTVDRANLLEFYKTDGIYVSDSKRYFLGTDSTIYETSDRGEIHKENLSPVEKGEIDQPEVQLRYLGLARMASVKVRDLLLEAANTAE